MGLMTSWTLRCNSKQEGTLAVNIWGCWGSIPLCTKAHPPYHSLTLGGPHNHLYKLTFCLIGKIGEAQGKGQFVLVSVARLGFLRLPCMMLILFSTPYGRHYLTCPPHVLSEVPAGGWESICTLFANPLFSWGCGIPQHFCTEMSVFCQGRDPAILPRTVSVVVKPSVMSDASLCSFL